MGNDNDQNQPLETRTVFYRMPPNSSAPPNVMQQNAPIMMGMPHRGPPRFNSNNNNNNAGKKRFKMIFDQNLYDFLFH